MSHLLGHNAEIFDPDQHFLHNPYHHYHQHHHHYTYPGDPHFTGPYDYGHHHHHHHYYTSHQAALSLELHRLNDYAIMLKQRINYYTTHNMSPPISLVNEFNHVNQLITTKSLYLPEHPHYTYEHHYETVFPHGQSLEHAAHGYLHYGGDSYFHDHLMHDHLPLGHFPACKYANSFFNSRLNKHLNF